MSLLAYQSVPVVPLPLPEAEAQGLSVSILREDLNHAYVSGNKWWKLQPNLEAAMQQGHGQLLTFGGPYSNHIYATAAAAREAGLKSVGIIRGEHVTNPTLRFAESCGMQLYFVTRAEYRGKMESGFLKRMLTQFGPSYILPEGGTNELAVASCVRWGEHLWNELHPDVVVLPVGTGGTLAGLVVGLAGRCQVIGFSALKGGHFLTDAVANLIKQNAGRDYPNWHIETPCHEGGYGKTTPALLQLMAEIENEFGVPLDPVYTAKMVMGVRALIVQKKFSRGSRIMILHTGGLQGRSGGSYASAP